MTAEGREKLIKQIDNGFQDLKLPLYMYSGVMAWVFEGRPQGSFLNAVLRNDLTTAAFKADSTNALKLVEWAKFCYWHLPGKCCGCHEHVDNWKGVDNV